MSVAQMLDVGVGHDYVATVEHEAEVEQLDVTNSLAIEASRIDPGLSW